MRSVTLLVAFVLAAGPALAQDSAPIAKSIERAAAAAATEPSAVTRQHQPLFWTGIALGVAGATVAVLGATTFRTESTTSGNTPKGAFQSCEALKSNPIYAGNQCDALKGPNLGMVWGGVSAAAFGVTLMALGASHSRIEVGPRALRFSLTWGSAPHPGSVARGAPPSRAAPSQARRARLTVMRQRKNFGKAA